MNVSTAGADTGHRHDASIEDVLAFVNTLEFSASGSREDLPTSVELVAWLREHGLVHDTPPAPGAAGGTSTHDDLIDRAHRLRTAFRRVIESLDERRPAPQSAVDEVNDVLRHAYAYELVPSPSGAVLGHRHPVADADLGLASLAAALVDDVADGHPERLKVCANDECRWVFRDASPAGRRRWCDMASCGNRAKARRHRERARAAAGATAGAATAGDGAGGADG